MAGLGMKLEEKPSVDLNLYPMPKKFSLTVSREMRKRLHKNGRTWASAYREAIAAFARLVSFGTNPRDEGTDWREAETPLQKFTTSVKAEGGWVREAFTEASKVEAVVNTTHNGILLEVRMFRTKEKTSFTTICLGFDPGGTCATGSFGK